MRTLALILVILHSCGPLPAFAQATVPEGTNTVCWPEGEAEALVLAWQRSRPLEERLRLLDQALVLERERAASLELAAESYRTAATRELRRVSSLEQRLGRARAPWRHPLVWLAIGGVLSLTVTGIVINR